MRHAWHLFCSSKGTENSTLDNIDKPVRNPYVVLREEFDDWAVLFNPDSGEGFGTNPAGVCIWKLLDGKRGLSDLVKELRSHAEDVPEDAIEHVSVLVATLFSVGLAAAEVQECQARRSVRMSLAESKEKGRFLYEAPTLVNLSSGQSALGSCFNHGSYGGNCYSGAGATGCCISGTCGTNNGNCCSGTCGTTNSCCSGACDGVACASGANPLNYPCSYGSTNPVMCACLSYGANATSCNSGTNVGSY